MDSLSGFLLTSGWCSQTETPTQLIEKTDSSLHYAKPTDHSDAINNILQFWWLTPEGPLLTEIFSPSICFITTENQPKAEKLLQTLAWPIRIEAKDLKNFRHQAVSACYLPEQFLSRWKRLLIEHHIPCWEHDIRPGTRYLMERFIYGSANIALLDKVQKKQYPENRQSPDFLSSQQVRFQPTVTRPKFKVWSLDIETSMPKPGKPDYLFSIGVVCDQQRWVWLIGQPDNNYDASQSIEVIGCQDEIDLLNKFQSHLQQDDPDLIIGWNIIQFDMTFLLKKFNQYKIPAKLGRAGGLLKLTTSHQFPDRVYCYLPGRLIIDGIDTLKSATYHFDSFALNDVARNILGQSKLLSGDDRGGDIEYLFDHDQTSFVNYNIRDCQLVWDIFDKVQLLEFLVERSHITGLAMDRMGGSVAAFENLYLPRLHRRGYIAPNMGEGYQLQKSPGGFVMDSIPGIYQHVLVLDFKSLYPSIIRTFHVDPLALIKGLQTEKTEKIKSTEKTNDTDHHYIDGYFGATFDTKSSVLPELIKDLASRREKAKAQGNQALSQAIKIIMASCYGVLGSEGCRFHDTRLSASITKRSHQVINQAADYIRQQGYDVIYGDTDSVFVWVKKSVSDRQADEIGYQLVNEINHYFQTKFKQEFAIESHLELEYETHYRKFFMPALRGTDTGSKKRYAGLKSISQTGTRTLSGELDNSQKPTDQYEVVFKGLEVVRSDWTALAKLFQKELYTRFFNEIDYQDWIATFIDQCLSGQYDDLLVYRKRLRRPLSDYQYSQPPHAKAARKYDEQRQRQQLHAKYDKRGGWIEYVMTKSGPEPIHYQQSMIDYTHYIEKQLKPIAEALLQFTGEDFGTLSGLQPSLF